jgi:hypothetical protein
MRGIRDFFSPPNFFKHACLRSEEHPGSKKD